jgi:hypothetical protein
MTNINTITYDIAHEVKNQGGKLGSSPMLTH